MARPKLSASKRRSRPVFVLFKRDEHRALTNVVARQTEFPTMSDVVREAFLAGVEDRRPKWATPVGEAP